MPVNDDAVFLHSIGKGRQSHQQVLSWHEILKPGLVKILKLKIYGEADVWLRFWSWCLVEILKMFDQDLCKNL